MTCPSSVPTRIAAAAALAVAALGGILAPPAVAQAPGRVEIVILQNGVAHGCTGTWEIRGADGGVVARGANRGTARVAPGEYVVSVAIDGVLDRPARTSSIVVSGARPARVQADFATGALTVSVTRAGQRAAAMIDIVRDGTRVATLASGVRGTLSAGTYTVRARHRGELREMVVQVPPGADATATLAFAP